MSTDSYKNSPLYTENMDLSLVRFSDEKPGSFFDLPVEDTGFQAEYKEYSFKTSQNKELEQKVASFWRALGDRKPPKTDIFKLPDIEECLDTTKDDLSTVEESLTEEESSISEQVSEKWKWTNTFCLFKKKNLDKAAKASVPVCSLCNNDKFAPLYADEVPINNIDSEQLDISSPTTED